MNYYPLPRSQGRLKKAYYRIITFQKPSCKNIFSRFLESDVLDFFIVNVIKYVPKPCIQSIESKPGAVFFPHSSSESKRGQSRRNTDSNSHGDWVKRAPPGDVFYRCLVQRWDEMVGGLSIHSIHVGWCFLLRNPVSTTWKDDFKDLT